MKKTLILGIIILTSNLVDAQFVKEKSINVQIGYGLSAPNNSVREIVDDGFLLKEN